jgi:hypothetical protein
MRLRFMYEGDGLIHSPPVAREAPAPRDARRAPAGGEIEEKRSAAMRQLFPKLSTWLRDRAHFARMQEVERYLARSADLADLERRIRRVERFSQAW